jgi:hypothetical protein
MAIFELALQPFLRVCRVIKPFDEDLAKKRQSYGLFAEVVNKLRDVTLPLFGGVLNPRFTRPFCAVPRTSVVRTASG